MAFEMVRAREFSVKLKQSIDATGCNSQVLRLQFAEVACRISVPVLVRSEGLVVVIFNNGNDCRVCSRYARCQPICRGPKGEVCAAGLIKCHTSRSSHVDASRIHSQRTCPRCLRLCESQPRRRCDLRGVSVLLGVGRLIGVALCVMLAMTYSRTGFVVLVIEAAVLWWRGALEWCVRRYWSRWK